MAITLDAISAALPAANFGFYKPSVTAEGVGTWRSLWTAAGSPAAGSTPPAFSAGSGYVPDRTTAGALGQSNPTNNRYLANLRAAGTVVGTLIVYDRLWHCSGFSTTSVSAQNVTTPGSLPSGRDPNTGDDVEMWLEVYTAPGATTATWTIVANDGGGSSRSYTYTHPANAETVGQMMPVVPPSTAAAGVQQVTSFTCSVSSGTAGSIGITLLRRLAEIPITTANIGAFQDHFATGMPEVYDDACIAFMVQCSTTSTGVFLGNIGLPDLAP